jgi:hypothetical protein
MGRAGAIVAVIAAVLLAGGCTTDDAGLLYLGRIGSYSVDSQGTTLTIAVFYGERDTLTGLNVQEAPDRITVTAQIRAAADGINPANAVAHTQTAYLAEPLAARNVIDGSIGFPVPLRS